MGAEERKMKVLETPQEFKELIGGEGLTLIDFYADWCGPCKAIAPELEKMADVFTDVQFAKVNVDENEEVAASEQISAMPTFKLYQNGQKIGEVVGASKPKIVELLEGHSKCKAE